MATIKAGDRVRHKTGGRMMAVAYISVDRDGDEQAHCEWIDADQDVAAKTFYTAVLEKQGADDETEAAIEIIIQIFIDFGNAKRRHENQPEMSTEEETSWRTQWKDAFSAMREAVNPADVVRAIKLLSDAGSFLP